MVSCVAAASRLVENATDVSESVNECSRVQNGAPSLPSQSLTVSSSDPEASRAPSGLKASAEIEFECPFPLPIGWDGRRVSHNMTAPSSKPAASREQSCDKASTVNSGDC